jgi:hypothetical protein
MRRIALTLVGVALAIACREEQVTSASIRRAPTAAAASRLSNESVEKDLATLRRVTASFHIFDKAKQAGWSEKITACMTDPGGAGGMGFHYGNTGLIDGSVSVDQPELLLYEPEKNGRLRLVAVEYIVPFTAHPRTAEPPELFGQKFQPVDAFQLWGLHAWVWEHNPSGMFANWNPRVNCDNTTDIMAMAHQ